VLWLHLDHSAVGDLDTFPAAVRTDRLGTLSSDLLQGWLADTTLVIRPVLDPSRTDAVDAHDPPAWMRELVILRDQHCIFPWCTRDARACDLDREHGVVPLLAAA
jgi:hypothetical protein